MSREVASRSFLVLKVVAFTAGLKVLLQTLAPYRDYWPPDFSADFLLGRDAYFWDGYHWAFYTHLIAGPITLVLGTLLLSSRFRLRLPGWHRLLGRVQVATILLLLVPSGMVMAGYADGGPVAIAGFTILAGLTGTAAILGWRAAVQRRFLDHRRWMWRCYLLLASTLVLRVTGGLGDWLAIESEWFYTQRAWTSWLVPLLFFELIERSPWGGPANFGRVP